MASSTNLLPASIKETPEYTTMRECQMILVDLLSPSINSVVDALFAKGMIPQDVKDEVQLNSMKISTAKTREVISVLTTRIKYHPSVFHEFVSLLKHQDLWTEAIAVNLTSCFESKSNEVASPDSFDDSKPQAMIQDQIHLKLTLPRKCSEEVQKGLSEVQSVQFSMNYRDQNEVKKTTLFHTPMEIVESQVSSSRGQQSQEQSHPNLSGAVGGRDVLFLVPNSTLYSSVSRKTSPLTHEECVKLEAQGVHRDCQQNDLSIMMARYSFDKLCDVKRSESNMTCDAFKLYVEEAMRKTDKDGIVLYYIGPGSRWTGDWCFSDGCITFSEIMELYSNHFKGRVLTIISDCSYSGSWVKKAMKFMDKQNVGPCGHAAKENRIMIKVFASCRASEVPTEKAFSVHCAKSDKNTGQLLWSIDYRSDEIHDQQHPCGIDFTKVRCKNKISEPCTMHPESTWEVWSYQVFLARNLDRGQQAWHYIMLNDNQDINNGDILESGWGKDPPTQIQEQITKQYFVDYNYQDTSFDHNKFEMSL